MLLAVIAQGAILAGSQIVDKANINSRGNTMRNSTIFSASLLLFFSLMGSVIHAEQNNQKYTVEAGCSDWKPFAYLENGEMKGSAYKIAKDVLEHAGVSYKYRILPWARVYNRGLKEKNYLIGCLGRTPKREDMFHWVGPVTKGVDQFFYKLKSNPLQISNIGEAKGHRIAVERGSYYQDFLELNDFKKINFVAKTEQLLMMLKNNRTSFIVLNESRFFKEAEKQNIDPDLFEKTLFAFNVTDNLAFNKETPPELVKKVTKAYQQLKKDGRISFSATQE